ncbi:MAG TPA: ATP-grasp domain-containing protein [Candidatus Saccharimonadales bacterium]|nr:ATP-grasp domain-containing protein [Candidatus Saccharimonadales bacterium]
MKLRDTILAINDVEPGLINAVKKHSRRLGRDLKGVVLIGHKYFDHPERAKDKTGFFKEIVCDFDNPDELQKILKPYQYKLLAATCRNESAIQQFRKVVPFLPYIHTPSASALQWANEKHLMRDRLRNYDHKLVPKYKYIPEFNPEILKSLTDHLSFPVIVKPIGLAASLLVERCDNESELKRCLIRTFQTIENIYSRERGRGRPSVLIEEMIHGDMYSTDAYVSPTGEIYCLPLVKVITAHAIGLQGFYSYRHIVPIDLSQKEVDKAFTVAADSIKALNLSTVTTHIELFQSPDGWKIIEVGPRIGGYREALYRGAYGVDHYYNDLAVRMGEKPEMPTKPIAHAAGLNIYPEQEGHIKSITGLEEARKLSSVAYLNPHAQPGDLALFAGNGGYLIVDGILSNKDPEKLEADVAKVRELIKINVDPTTYLESAEEPLIS